ncbi:MAG: NIPSNAP family containing protein [Bacteroidetes bacterium]|nr:NIPSNAP family containing protein [Bacteroidota bacterium]MBT4399658.1 NIPSNAP family containing protein [Bacteroidota bacterium]MBT4409545.1 NIPSNAP family containing protein [Bacteroidota bacterium]MBT5426101.1 NIPSNAP family containing protein [Bacteroidota bacterium]MBT7092521.1 NIPSNAP family containing protein [Bacteroidota bacterium]
MLCYFVTSCDNPAEERDIYQIKIYSIENEQQESRIDNYLKDAFMPALHRAGISKIGVFKPVEEDDRAGNFIYVLIPFESVNQFEKLGAEINLDEEYLEDGRDYIDAAHDNPAYKRIESILLRSFITFPKYGTPNHSTPPSERIYELRSYHASTEKLYEKKVEMFNDGKETELFVELEFQPIFFGEVISGSSMPNLMYLTTFENRDSQKKHWETFVNSPEWTVLKGDPQYKNTVSKIDKVNLHPAIYSEL